MRRTVIVAIAALALAPVSVAQAPNVFRLHVNDKAVLRGANVECVVKTAGVLTCGGGTSKVFVQFRRGEVQIFRATGPSAIFKSLYRVSR